MIPQVSQPQREALALQFFAFASHRGANAFQLNRMVHEARWGGCDVQLLRKLRAPRPDARFMVFSNAFGEFNVPVVISSEQGVKMMQPQNERLYRIFQEMMNGMRVSEMEIERDA